MKTITDFKQIMEVLQTHKNVHYTGETLILQTYLENLPEPKNIMIWTYDPKTAIRIGVDYHSDIFNRDYEEIDYHPNDYADIEIVLQGENLDSRAIQNIYNHYLSSACRKGKYPQLIIVGDFFEGSPMALNDSYIPKYAVESEYWQKLNFTEVHERDVIENFAVHGLRRKDDQAIQMLNDRVDLYLDSEAVRMCYSDFEADAHNKKWIDFKGRDRKTYIGSGTGQFRNYHFPVPREMELRENTRVILCADDLENGLYDVGMMGTIKSLRKDSVLVTLDFSNTDVLVKPHTWQLPHYRTGFDEYGDKVIYMGSRGEYTQLPILPGYAISLKNAYGMKFHKVIINPNVKRPMLLFAALSFARNIESISLTSPIKKSNLQIPPFLEDYIIY